MRSAARAVFSWREKECDNGQDLKWTATVTKETLLSHISPSHTIGRTTWWKTRTEMLMMGMRA